METETLDFVASYAYWVVGKLSLVWVCCSFVSAEARREAAFVFCNKTETKQMNMSENTAGGGVLQQNV